MTTLELFKKHRKGEVSRERFLYEVRRDNNLPWVTNTTSYDDAVKILKNKGIIREAYENVATDPAVDRVNPYYLKKGVEKLLSKEKELTNDSYNLALNKAAKQLAANPHAFDKEKFGNAESVAKADAKLKMTPVKNNNFVDKENGMKKIKGQETLKAMSAPTKENRKGKPKGVKVMPDKGVEGKEKVIKEISDYVKKKLKLDENTYHDFHEGMVIPMEEGEGIVKEINGGTLCVEMPDGSLKDVQMNHAQHLIQKEREQHEDESGLHQSEEHGFNTMKEDQNQPDYYINVSIRDASRAIEVYRDLNIIPREAVKMDGTDSYVIDDLEIAQELLNAFKEENIEVIHTDVPNDDDNFGYDDEELYEATPFEQNPFDKTVDEILDTIQGSQILDDRFKELAAKVLDSILELVQAGSFEKALFMLKKLQKSIEDRHMNSRSDSQEYAFNYKSYFETLENFLNAELGSDQDLEEAGVQITPRGGTPIFKKTADSANTERELRDAGIAYTKKSVG
jgi:hypothetical protein